jgi:hypothetical protein
MLEVMGIRGALSGLWPKSLRPEGAMPLEPLLKRGLGVAQIVLDRVS